MKTFIALLLSFGICVSVSHANLITDGDFESGGLASWTDAGGASASVVTGGSQLDGTFSVFLPGSGDGNISQAIAPVTGPALLSLQFSMPDPGASRGFNMFLGGSGTQQVNLRVVDAVGTDGIGDVQIFNSATSWETVLTDAVTYNQTTSLSLTVNDYGASFDYDLDVGGNTANGLGFFQNGALSNVSRISLVNDFGTADFTVDNISITAVPEPSVLAMLVLGLAGILARRRG